MLYTPFMAKAPVKDDFVRISMLLRREELDRLAELSKERGHSRTDYLRAALLVPEAVPVIKTAPLRGACLDKHLARLEREKRERRRAKRKG